MGSPIPSDRMQSIARIDNVREVAVYGTADLDAARTLLPPGLQPYARSGAAEVLITASALVWQGLRFRELIVTVATSLDDAQPQPDSQFLALAFNSARSLAWAERRLFKTPYAHADVRVSADAPQMELWQGRRPLFQARMAQAAEPSARIDAAWQGPVVLPTHGAPGRHFIAALSGEQLIYPFAADTDMVLIAPDGTYPLFRWLSAAHFTPTEWRVRANATHARSRTYRSKRP